MIEFYLIKYHPLLNNRNWFKIWDENNKHFIKIIINPISNIWTIYADNRHINDYQILLTPYNEENKNTSNNLSSVKYFYLEIKNKNTSFHLPKQNTINFYFIFENIRVEHTSWLSLLIYNNYTNKYINTSIVDSIANNIIEHSDNIISTIDNLDYSSSDVNSQTEIDNAIKKLINDGTIINDLTKNKKKSNILTFTSKILTEPIRYYPKYNKYRTKKLSFCITCLKRLSQICNTLPQNLRDNIPMSNDIEFILIDFGTPGLYNWLLQNFKWALKIGYLRYYKTSNLPKWHASIAKNTVHRLAIGEILVNLDCDNYTGTLGSVLIMNIFKKYKGNIILHQWSGTSKDGTYGRLSYRRNNFMYLGGYDQSFYPMGYQDHDLIMRFRLAFGANKYILASSPDNYSRAIENDKFKKLINTKYFNKISWQDMNTYNKQKSNNNINNRKYKVNSQLDYIGIII